MSVARDHRVLFPRRRLSPLTSIGVRVGIAIGCLVVTTVVVYLGRSGYRDVKEVPITLLDALYYATVSLSTTGYGDITPVTEPARLINTLVITPLRLIFLVVLVGTTVEVLTARSRQEIQTHRWRRRMKDHTVVVGYGVKGRSAVTALLEGGIPRGDIVVVSTEPGEVADATALGLVGVVGDARQEVVLRDALVDRASRLVVATDHDDVSVLVTLTARRLAPHATIVVAARESVNAELLRQGGADTVITTAEAAGRLLTMSLLSPTAGGILEDLLEVGRGLDVVERQVAAAELGRAPRDLESEGVIVLAVVRGGQPHRFDAGSVGVLQRDDRVVLIRSEAAPG
ncbi:MAG: potassium channel protein [Actinomycetota bacterium]|nr:MAG: potassium channel protein [Actinomycetota bacterium]